MLALLTDPQAWIAFATLVTLEIVLGIDNIIFINVLVGRLPLEQRDSARRLGILFALGTRILLVISLFWIMGLVKPWFILWGYAISGRDLILIIGGLFLLAKSTHEIHLSLEEAGQSEEVSAARRSPNFWSVIVQVGLLDIVFSLDSVITAVGLVKHVEIMIAAIMAAVLVMLIAVNPIGRFIDRNPTFKLLALSFLILIGFVLIGEGLDVHVPKGYIYFAMCFSFCVELLNSYLRRKAGKRNIDLNDTM